MPDSSAGPVEGRWTIRRVGPSSTRVVADGPSIRFGQPIVVVPASELERVEGERDALRAAAGELRATAEGLLGDRERAMESDRHRIRADDAVAERDAAREEAQRLRDTLAANGRSEHLWLARLSSDEAVEVVAKATYDDETWADLDDEEKHMELAAATEALSALRVFLEAEGPR